MGVRGIILIAQFLLVETVYRHHVGDQSGPLPEIAHLSTEHMLYLETSFTRAPVARLLPYAQRKEVRADFR
jgi:hypothetical protein